MTAFQAIFVPFCGLVAAVILARTARAKVARRSGLFWTSVWAAAAVLIARPDTTTRIAGWLGIGRGADLVLYLTSLGLLATGVYFYSRYRRLERLITGVIRREAIRDARHGVPPAAAASPSAPADHA